MDEVIESDSPPEMKLSHATLSLVNIPSALNPVEIAVQRLPPVLLDKFFQLSKARQRSYLVGRLLLANCLETVFPDTTGGWEIQDQIDLPPVVSHAQTNHQVKFSLSHSGQWVGLVILEPKAIEGAHLGLDIEIIRNRELAFAKKFCNQSQIEKLKSAKTNLERSQQTTRLWTQKEAYFKAYQQSIFNPQLKALSARECNTDDSLGFLCSGSIDDMLEVSVFSNKPVNLATQRLEINQAGDILEGRDIDILLETYNVALDLA